MISREFLSERDLHKMRRDGLGWVRITGYLSRYSIL